MSTPTERIAAHDRVLSTLREAWTEAKPDTKSKWMERINLALDERLLLMKERDCSPWSPTLT
jgi:hypothetical protein